MQPIMAGLPLCAIHLRLERTDICTIVMIVAYCWLELSKSEYLEFKYTG